MPDDFTLHVGDRKHQGWTSLQITRSLDQLAHSFNVQLTDKWTGQEEPIQISAGNECFINFGTQRVVTGYVDDDGMNYNASQRSISISGRSKTSDLVDCAALRADKKRAWRNLGLAKIAADLCDPFGITAQVKADGGSNFKRFAIEDGETAFQCLQRAARMRGLLMLTDGSGKLVFDRAGTKKVTPPLKFGENILSCNHRRSMRDRFSEYRVQCQISGNDETSGKSVTIRRTAEDKGVPRYRPTIIMADTEDSGSELKKRADWEANVRLGQSRTVTYTVRGWESDQGLWEPNTLVKVIDPQVFADVELLITAVTFQRNNQGTTTQLTLTDKRAYDVQPIFPQAPTQKKTEKDWFAGLGP